MGKMNFIKTKENETAEVLKKEGFTLLNSDGGVYTFLNNSTFSFSEKPKDIIYTNVMCM